MNARRPWLRLVLDVAVSLVLANVAAMFADIAMRFLTPNVDWMYIPWFSAGMLPLAFYARFRGVAEFKNRDLLYWAPVPFVLGLIVEFAASHYTEIILVWILVQSYSSLLAGIRRRYADRSENT